jgi:prepilin-type N-terminal cleavage/methylation domain-containing protein
MIIKKKKGMTLIEVIIAIAILGIIGVAFLTLFTSGFSFITRAGNRSEAGFNTQTQVEQALNNAISTPDLGSLQIQFSDGTTISAIGYKSSQTCPTINGSQATINFFKPTN